MDLSQLLNQRKKDRIQLIGILMECLNVEDKDVCHCITEFCWIDNLLIPDSNTLDEDEFLKYWFVVPPGNEVNHYRDVHDVQIKDSQEEQGLMVQLIRRGAIATIHEYKANKEAKLKLECKFQWSNTNHFLTISTQTDGDRDTTVRHRSYGVVEDIGRFIRICQGQWGPPRVAIEIDNRETQVRIPTAKCCQTVSAEIIEDGQNLKMKYIADGKTYSISSNKLAIAKPTGHRVTLFNRECPGNIVDISHLSLSIV